VAALIAKDAVAPYTGQLDAAGQQLRACLTAVADSLTAAAAQLNAADSKVGDGDCGSTLAAGAAALQQRLQANTIYVHQPAVAMRQVAAVVQHSMGGTSGGLYGVALTAAAASLGHSSGGQGPGLQAWAAAFAAGVAAVEKYGGAGRGARTMVDALAPAAQALEEGAAAGEGWVGVGLGVG
jgi:dihydroxyacetone kinase